MASLYWRKWMKRFFWMVPVSLLFIVFFTFYLFEKQPQTSRLEKNFLWGHELFEEGKWDLAAKQYEKNLILNPQTSESHLQLAILYDDYLNQKNKAIEHYEKYLEMASDDEKASLVREWLEDARKENKEGTNIATKKDLKEKQNVLIENKSDAKLQAAQQSQKIQDLQDILKQKEDEIQNLKIELDTLHSKTPEQKTDSRNQAYEDIKSKFDQQSATLAKLQNDIYQKDKNIQHLQAEMGKVHLEKIPQDKLLSELNQNKKALENVRSDFLKMSKDYKDALKRI
jgi:chromosome segregation ATPase